MAACRQHVPVRPGARVPLSRLALPLSKCPGLTVFRFSLIDSPGPESRLDLLTINVRLIYLSLRRGVWTITDFSFMHRARTATSQVRALLCLWGGGTIPSLSPRRTQAMRRFAQVIHMAVHSMPTRRTYHRHARGLRGNERQEPAGVDAGLLRRSDGGSSACSGQHQQAGISGEPAGGSGRRQQSGLP
jgi:hypothetical protein